MTDPLQNLLQSADAANTPSAPDDLVAKVHRRQKARATKSRQLKIGISVSACVALAFAVLLTQQPWPKGHGQPAAPIAQNTLPSPLSSPAAAKSLLREAAEIKAEADALEKLLAAHERQTHLTELAVEYDRLLVATSAPDPEEAALERAAARAICQADFLLDTLNDRLAAVAAYRNITEQFPNTRWAMIAQDNLSRLEMN